MTRLIDAEALKKAIEEVEDNYDGYEPNDLGKFMYKVGDLIDNAPTVDPCDNCDLYFIAKTKKEMRKGGAK